LDERTRRERSGRRRRRSRLEENEGENDEWGMGRFPNRDSPDSRHHDFLPFFNPRTTTSYDYVSAIETISSTFFDDSSRCFSSSSSTETSYVGIDPRFFLPPQEPSRSSFGSLDVRSVPPTRLARRTQTRDLANLDRNDRRIPPTFAPSPTEDLGQVDVVVLVGSTRNFVVDVVQSSLERVEIETGRVRADRQDREGASVRWVRQRGVQE
jgi:hypothetical protein